MLAEGIKAQGGAHQRAINIKKYFSVRNNNKCSIEIIEMEFSALEQQLNKGPQNSLMY